MIGRWDFFPSVDQVIAVIENIQREPNNFQPCTDCINGWKVEEVDSPLYKSGKTKKAVRCKCWYEWSGRN